MQNWIYINTYSDSDSGSDSDSETDYAAHD